MNNTFELIMCLVLACAAGHRVCAAASRHPNPDRQPAKENIMVTVRPLKEDGTVDGPVKVRKIEKSDLYWQRVLTPEQYRIARGRGTERAFCGRFHDHKKDGIYICVCCGLPLFDAGAKFDSGTGWPSFLKPAAAENVAVRQDLSGGMRRTEVLCVRCDAHLGHVFEDGPKPTGLRYCLNSESLTFLPHGAYSLKSVAVPRLEQATFAAGCFWGVESLFRQMDGVKEVMCGYTGGRPAYPTYEEVCSGRTGHAEAVLIIFDRDKVSYPALLKIFFDNHNPTTPNRQGPDTGSQYRSAIFCHGREQKKAAAEFIRSLEGKKTFSIPIVTEVADAVPFYRAEEYHQRWNEKRGTPSCLRPSVSP